MLRPLFLCGKDFEIMLGLGDNSIVCAVVGCIVIAVVGIIYGALNWNSNK